MAFRLSAFAVDMEDIVEKLHDKGVISEEEYQEMRTEARAEKRKEALDAALEEEQKAKAKDLRQGQPRPGAEGRIG